MWPVNPQNPGKSAIRARPAGRGVVRLGVVRLGVVRLGVARQGVARQRTVIFALAMIAVLFAVGVPARGYAAESPHVTEPDVAGAPVPFGSAVNYGAAPAHL